MIDDKQKKMIEEYAQMVATNLILYGVDMRDKYDSAVSMSVALENAYLRGRADGLKYAYERAKKVGEWIPCSERLPDHEGRYLTTCRENRIAQIRIYEGNGFWDSINEVIAWQPLPEPYKE